MSARWLSRLAPVLIAAGLISLAAHGYAAQGPPGEARAPGEVGLILDAIFAADAGGREPSQIAWRPDGSGLSYCFEGQGGPALFLLDVASGESRPLLPIAGCGAPEDGEPAGLHLEEYGWSPRGDALLIESGGDLHLHLLGDGSTRRLTSTDELEEDPKFSPDGSRVAFVRGADLHLLEIATGQERALTTDGEEDVTLNGTTDWVYWEEIWGRAGTGFWWSPDGSRIAYYRFDETPVDRYPLVDFTPTYPAVTWQRYPKAGRANPAVRVGVLDLGTGQTAWMGTGPAPEAYLARVDWLPGGDALVIQRLNRDQTRLDLLRCQPDDGVCTPVLTEEWPTWVNLSDEYRFLSDGRLLWSSERSGWRHLYLYGADGGFLRQLTSGAGAVTSLDAVDEERGWVVYTAFGAPPLGAAERKVYRVALDQVAPLQVLTPETGWNEALVAPDGAHWLHTWSDADTPPERTVYRIDGPQIAPLPFEPPAGYDPAALPRWRFLAIPGPEGSELPARMLEPSGLDPGGRYPAIVYHYGGPGSQVVVNRWESAAPRHLARTLWHKMMAERGYAVLMVDNLASIFFGKRGEDRLHRRFGDQELAGQLAGVELLRRLVWVDMARVGLWGWSGGGSNTLYSVLNRPGVWRAGVAGAPVTDWTLYDTIWTERYLDHPEDNPEGYRASSPVTHAARLRDALLVVHGTADDNVHPQNTLVLTRSFVEAGVPFEHAIYPRQTHGFAGAPLRHFFARMTAFFERHLG